MRAAVLLVFAFAFHPAGAQQVWRCGNSYGEKPCAGGQALDVGDPASAQRAADAGAVARRDMALADRLEKARLAQEARAPKAVIPPEPKVAASAANKAKAKKPQPRRSRENGNPEGCRHSRESGNPCGATPGSRPSPG